MQTSPKTVSYGGKKPRFRRRTVFAKNLGFGVSFGYRNNTREYYTPQHMNVIITSAKEDTFSLLWPAYVIGQVIIFSPMVSSSFYLSIFFLSSPNLGCRRLPYIHTWCGLSANVRCRSETCWTWLAENTGCKKVAKNRHLGTIAQFCRAISSQLRHVSTIGKTLLSSNMSSRCPHNMVNFGPLAAEISLPVWGTLANFNSFRVLASLLLGSQVVGASQTLRR